MHDRLYANQQNFEPWTVHAEAIGLDIAKFQDCLSSGRSDGEIRKDMDEIKAILLRHEQLLLHHDDQLSKLPEVLREKIGFKA